MFVEFVRHVGDVGDIDLFCGRKSLESEVEFLYFIFDDGGSRVDVSDGVGIHVSLFSLYITHKIFVVNSLTINDIIYYTSFPIRRHIPVFSAMIQSKTIQYTVFSFNH